MKMMLRKLQAVSCLTFSLIAAMPLYEVQASVIDIPKTKGILASGYSWGTPLGSGNGVIHVCWKDKNNRPKTGNWGDPHYATDNALKNAISEWNSHLGDTVTLKFRNKSCDVLESNNDLSPFYIKIADSPNPDEHSAMYTSYRDVKTNRLDPDDNANRKYIWTSFPTIHVCDARDGTATQCDWCQDANDGTTSDPCADAQGYFTHEIGHALALQHEQKRTDAKCPGTTTDIGNELGAQYRWLTTDDSCNSAMSYKDTVFGDNGTKRRKPWRNLSTKDARGIRTILGQYAKAAWLAEPDPTDPNKVIRHETDMYYGPWRNVTIPKGKHTLGYGALQHSTSLKPQSVTYWVLSYSANPAREQRLIIQVRGDLPSSSNREAFPVCVLSKHRSWMSFPVKKVCVSPNDDGEYPTINVDIPIFTYSKIDYFLEFSSDGAEEYNPEFFYFVN